MSRPVALLASLLLTFATVPIVNASILTNGNCVTSDSDPGAFFQGNQDIVHSGHATAGAKASVDVGSGASFAPCDSTDSNDGGALGWVAIVPINDTDTTILQIRISSCN